VPIRPENKDRYPKDWPEIRKRILERAKNRCEFCGVENHTFRENYDGRKPTYIVLTIAHLDHTPENCDPDNLRALCQACHLEYDREHHEQTKWQIIERERDKNQMFLFKEYEPKKEKKRERNNRK
jgi:hypothetical protein